MLRKGPVTDLNSPTSWKAIRRSAAGTTNASRILRARVAAGVARPCQCRDRLEGRKWASRKKASLKRAGFRNRVRTGKPPRKESQISTNPIPGKFHLVGKAL